jgi:TldD protein
VSADPTQLRELVQRAVDAAKTIGATYADARLTRVVQHRYNLSQGKARFVYDGELVGLGVRALVNGAWGFAAAPLWIGDPAAREDVVSIANDAVQQAKVTSRGSSRPVELASTPVVTGHWTTPIKTDPFTVSLEEKIETAQFWCQQMNEVGLRLKSGGWHHLDFAREERAMATSEGTLLTQTVYVSGGSLVLEHPDGGLFNRIAPSKYGMRIDNIEPMAKGWELFTEDAKLVQQFERIREELPKLKTLGDSARSGDVGRYTVVCDGLTMASILEKTLGLATQLDRALGYEANGGGVSFIDDPLAMVGHLQVASPVVTVTANRSAPGQIATVKWDDEGVEPQPFTLLKDGILSDFQTTREQALWLAPYYQQIGQPVRSNGCAAAEDALFITVQHMPNLSLEPSKESMDIDALIAGVKKGVFIERCIVGQADSQGRSGLVADSYDPAWSLREINNGRLGKRLSGMGLMFDTTHLWKNVRTVGGSATVATTGTSRYDVDWDLYGIGLPGMAKGFPAQKTSHSIQAAAAVIDEQTLIDITRKA